MTDSPEELHRIAEETSHRIQPDDPMTEPPNSTVDDWLGQKVDREAEQMDRDPDAPGLAVNDRESAEVAEPNEPA